MKHREARRASRRDWLAAGLRWLSLLAVTGVSAMLWSRRHGTPCPLAAPCGDCRRRTTCSLPPAADWKRNAKGERHA